MSEGRLAIDGGEPVRERMLPYGRQEVSRQDVEAVAAALTSDWLTTGPRVAEFEEAFASAVDARHAVAVSTGTAALHAAVHAAGVGPGDEVIVPALTFAATANAVVYEGAVPVFADVDPQTLLVDPGSVAERVSPRTRAVIGVDYGGQPCDYAALGELASQHGLALMADACHALGATDEGRPVGSLAQASTFSFHPVKPMTTGEGGMVTTDEAEWAARMRQFRNHGIATDFRDRERAGSWFYEMVELGNNYRLSDLQCALGRSQLDRLPDWVRRRREIAARYAAAFADLPGVEPLAVRAGVKPAWHLYVVRLTGALAPLRARLFTALRAEGIGVNVHYVPVHLHPYYRRRFGTRPGLCPRAEEAYERILTLPIFPAMSDSDCDDVVRAMAKVASHHRSG